MTSDDDRREMPEYLPRSSPEGRQRRFRHISHRTGFRLSADRLIAKPASAGKPPDGVLSSLPTGPPPTNGAARLHDRHHITRVSAAEPCSRPPAAFIPATFSTDPTLKVFTVYPVKIVEK